MRKYILTALLLTASTVPALAQNDLALCKLRAQHTASAGVAYQGGVDVRGNPVVPADVNGVAPSMVPDVIRIPLTVDLAQRLSAVPTGAELKADTGMVEIHKDGLVTFNGQDLSQAAAVVCGDQVPAQQQVPPAQAQATAPVVPAAPIVPNAPAAPLVTNTKIVVPVDAPPVPMATVPVTQAPNYPVVSRITTQERAPVPANAMATKPLPPQTLGQFIVPAKASPGPQVAPAPVAPVVQAPVVQAPAAPVPAPAAAPAAPSAEPMGERTNADLEKDDEIIWGQGN